MTVLLQIQQHLKSNAGMTASADSELLSCDLVACISDWLQYAETHGNACH